MNALSAIIRGIGIGLAILSAWMLASLALARLHRRRLEAKEKELALRLRRNTQENA